MKDTLNNIMQGIDPIQCDLAAATLLHQNEKLKKDFERFSSYLAIKMHFSPSSGYDFFKYRGKIDKSIVLKFLDRNDLKLFRALPKVYPNEHDILNLFISNFIVDHKTWIGDLIDGKVCEERLNRWNQFDVNPYYHFESDIMTIRGGTDQSFVARCLHKNSSDDAYPILVQKLLDKLISLQSFILIYNLIPDVRIGIDHMLMHDTFWMSRFSRSVKIGYPFVLGKHTGFKGHLYSSVEELDILKISDIMNSHK